MDDSKLIAESGGSPPSQLILDTLRVEDLPALMEIEERSFSSPWSEGTYRHELLSNPMAFYFVVRPPLATQAGAPGTESSGPEVRPAQATGVAASAGEQPQHAHPLVAYGGFWLTGDEAHIVTIASHHDLRRRKLGEIMLLFLLQQAQSLGATLVTLEVRPSNAPALALYKKWGFVEEGRRKQYYRDNREDALIYTLRDLDNPMVFLPIVFTLGMLVTSSDLLDKRESGATSTTDLPEAPTAA